MEAPKLTIRLLSYKHDHPHTIHNAAALVPQISPVIPTATGSSVAEGKSLWVFAHCA
jgi:hypothetical protein